MEGYRDQIPAFVSLFRALFGDFDINEIMDNSSGYLNTMLFLGYLFIAIFIMLSMFLAILAEAQMAVREDEKKAQLNPEFREYGVIAHAYEFGHELVMKLASKEKSSRSAAVGEVTESATTSSSNAVAPAAASAELAETNRAVLAALQSLQAEVSQLRQQVGVGDGDGTNKALLRARRSTRRGLGGANGDSPAGGALTESISSASVTPAVTVMAQPLETDQSNGI